MSITDLYSEGQYLENNPTWHIKDSPWKAKQVLKIINVNQVQVNSICEIGCGAGEILRQLYLHMSPHISFIGYEVSPQAFELCKDKIQDRLNFKLCNLLQEKESFFDLVLCLDVIEHIPDYLGFLEALRTKSRYKIFHIPLEISVSTVLRGNVFLQTRHKFGHLHQFTKETALAALKDTGYKIIDFFYTPYYVESTNKSLKGLIMTYPRKFMYGINQDLTVRILGGYPLLVLAE